MMAGGILNAAPRNPAPSRNTGANSYESRKEKFMKRYLARVFCTVLFLANWIAMNANAQTSSKNALQSHLAAAKDAAYEPGNDLTVLYDTVCEPALSDRGPREPNIQA